MDSRTAERRKYESTSPLSQLPPPLANQVTSPNCRPVCSIENRIPSPPPHAENQEISDRTENNTQNSNQHEEAEHDLALPKSPNRRIDDGNEDIHNNSDDAVYEDVILIEDDPEPKLACSQERNNHNVRLKDKRSKQQKLPCYGGIRRQREVENPDNTACVQKNPPTSTSTSEDFQAEHVESKQAAPVSQDVPDSPPQRTREKNMNITQPASGSSMATGNKRLRNLDSTRKTIPSASPAPDDCPKKGKTKKKKKEPSTEEIKRQILHDLSQHLVGIAPAYFGVEHNDIAATFPIGQYGKYQNRYNSIQNTHLIHA